jgi:hypothetical protein
MLINKDVCLQILNKVKEDSFIDAVPKTNDQIIKQGTFWIEETLKARQDIELKRDKTVVALSNIIATHRYFTD